MANYITGKKGVGWSSTPFFFMEVFLYRGLSFFVLLLSLIVASYSDGNAYTEQPKLLKTAKLFDIEVQLPTDVVVSKGKKIYAVDGTRNRVSVFGYNGAALFSFGKKGSENGMFNSPTGIGIDKDDNLYVCDSGNRRIQIFNSSGTFLRSFTVKEGASGPARPVDVAINNRTNLCYITDSANHRIVVCDLKGKQVYEWGGKGDSNQEFRYPATVAFAEYLYIVDSLNSRVQVYEGGGIFVKSIGKWGVLPGEFFRPKGVAISNEKDVFVSDGYMDVIEVFGEEGYKYVLGDEKGEIRRFASPLGIFIEGDRLYVSEMVSNRIGVYSIEK